MDNSINQLFDSLARHHPFTAEHCRRVGEHATALGRALGLDESALATLRTAATLHDIGKLLADTALLDKIQHGESFTPDEKSRIRVHPLDGETLLREHGFPPEILAAVRHHHEHFDGTGHPDGLRADAIPPAARIIAVADHFDAIAAHHPDAPARLAALASSRLDPALVRRFLELL